jgi:hypothetical protein
MKTLLISTVTIALAAVATAGELVNIDKAGLAL